MVEQNASRDIEGNRRWRMRPAHRLLLASTALSAAILLSTPVGRAQTPPLPPANATPQGGQVVGGSASIVQGAASTTINQASERTAINWQSFNVGSNAQVTFNQPNAQAVALNRVMANNPSVIAGHINANGQIVLMNQAGVVFAKGAQVNAEAIVVSTAGISTKKFMAGSMDFNQAPHPGASIVNDGTITVKQAGLAALVAPQVINHGLITAKLGHVILAGAETFTLDLYGDHLISLDVTKAVTKVDLGGKSVNALVTNDGVVIADGGTIQITAAQADQLVQSVLNVGGVLRADSVGQSKGSVLIQGVGGDIQIAGNVLARGAAPGSSGGTIGIDATGAVSVSSGARIDASGAAGGGVVALGTSVQRAQQGPSDKSAPRAASVNVAKGAEIKADATQSGNGGQIVLLSHNKTTQAGEISAQGNGDGGTAEISSDGIILLSGTENVAAPSGHAGSVLLDPASLIVGTALHGTGIKGVTNGSVITFGNNTTHPNVSYIDPTAFNSILSGTIVLQAASYIGVNQAIQLNSGVAAMTLTSGGSIDVNQVISLHGNLEIDAGSAISIAGSLNAAAINMISGNGIDLTSAINANNVTLLDTSNTLGVTLAAPITVGTAFAASIVAGGLVESTDTSGHYVGTLSAVSLTSDGGTIGGGVTLGNPANAIGTVGAFTVATANGAGGSLSLVDQGSLAISGSINAAGNVSFTAATIGITGLIDAAGISLTSAGQLAGGISAQAGSTISSSGTISIQSDAGVSLAGALDAVDLFTTDSNSTGNGVTFSGPILVGSLFSAAIASGGLVDLKTGSPNSTYSGILTIGTLSSGGGAIVGGVSLGNGADQIGTLGALSVTSGNVILADAVPLTLNGVLDAAGNSVSLTDPAGITQTSAGGIIARDLSLANATAAINLASTLNNFGGFAGVTVSNGAFSLLDAAALTITGPIEATSILLGAADLSLDALVSAGSDLTLASVGTGGSLITQSGSGLIVARTLTTGTGTIGGTVDLPDHTSSLSNQIGTLAAFSTTGALTLDEAGSLTIAGLVEASTINFGAQTGLTETNGTISTGLFTDTATLTGLTLGGPNSIATLAAFDAGGYNINLNDPRSRLTLESGSFVAGGITLEAAGLNLNGTLNAGPGTVALGSLDGVTQGTAGAITASVLMTDGTLAGPIGLGSTNSINTLGVINLGTSGGFDLADSVLLTIGGSLTATQATLGNHGVDILAPISVRNGLTFNGVGLINEGTNGALTAAIVEGTGSFSAVNLDPVGAAVNSIGALGAITASGNISLSTNEALAIVGDVSTQGTLALGALGLNETLAGAINANTVIELASFAKSVNLGSSANTITNLGSFDASSGNFVLRDNTALSLNSPLVASNVKLIDPIGLTFDSTISVGPSGSIALISDALSDPAGVFLAPGGTIAVAPFNNAALYLGSVGGSSQSLDISGSLANALLSSAQLVVLGSATANGTSFAASSIIGAGVIGTVTNALDLLSEGAFTNHGTLTGGASSSLLIDVAGSVDNAGTLQAETLDVVSGASFMSGGLIDAVMITGSAGTGISLNDSQNSIDIIGGLTAGTAGILIDDRAGLTLDGPIVAGSAALMSFLVNAVQATIGASISDPGGTVSFAPLGSTYNVVVGTDASAGTLGLGVNLFGEISPNVAALVIGDHYTPGLTVGQGVSLGMNNVFLVAQTIGIGGSLVVPGTLDLLAGTGGIGQSAAMNVGKLIGTASGGVVLNYPTNQIGALGNFSAPSQNFSLSDSENLTVDGVLLAKTASLSAPSLDLTGFINAPGTLSLSGTHGIDEPGSIKAGALIGGSSGAVFLTGSNSITDLSSFSVSGNSLIDLSDSSYLLVSGLVTAGEVTLNAAGMSISGAITTPGTLAFGGSGAITATGPITATSVTSAGLINGNISLLGSNAIADLGSLTASGSLVLKDMNSLTIAAPVLAAAATLTADGISLPSFLSVSGALALDSSAPISETGSINAGTLVNNAPNSSAVDLIGTNIIANLGAFTQSGTGTLVLDDGKLLTVTGPVSGGLVSLISSPGLSITGSITVATLALGGGPVNEASTGSVDGILLQSVNSISGNVSLVGSNSIAQVANFYDNGSLTIHDGSNLLLDRTVSASNAAFMAPSLNIAGLLDIGAVITFDSTGNVSEPGSLIVGTALDGSINGDLSLTGTNSIASIGSLFDGGTVVMIDAVPLVVVGPLDAQAASLTSPSIAVNGSISIASTLALGSSSGVSETGVISAATLISNDGVGGAVNLTGANNITDLGNFSVASGGSFDLVDHGGLTLAGSLFAPNATLSAASLSLPGFASVSGVLALGSGGTIGETGNIDAPTLISAAMIGGDAYLTGSNSIATLGAFVGAAGTTLVLDDASLLTVAGPVSAGSISLLADGLSIPGTISTSSALQLQSAAPVNESGLISAATLLGTGIMGATSLGGANKIDTFANFIEGSGGALFVNNDVALTLAQTIIAPNAEFEARFLAINGLVSVSGALALGSSAGINEIGIINADMLESTGVIHGDASLTGANLINTLGAWNNTGSLTLADSRRLTVAGPLDAGAARLQAPSIDFAGPVAVNTVLSVHATGSIGQTGGTITVPTLVSDGIIGGSVNLGDANAILNLASFTVQGDLFLHDASSLTAGDPVSSVQAITLDASGINLVGDLQAATRLLLGGSGPVTEASNAVINTPLLESFGTLLGAVQLDSAVGGNANSGNQIGSIGQFLLLNQSFSLIDNRALTVIGPIAAKAVSLTTQGLLTLDGVAGGGLYISGVYETPPGATVAPNPTSLDSVLTVNGPSPQLVQTGTFTIDGPPLAGTSVYPNSDNTVFVHFDPGKPNAGSNATFQALQALSTELILELNSGTSSGQVFLNRLLVVGNSGGKVNFFGTLGGVGGPGAAHNGTVFPFPNSNYQFNACPIESVNCTILPIETVPVTSPLLNFDLTPPRRRKLDRNVRLPGIAARDY
ncbi:MAG TPA: filamentous hemagglutinin N-terminal domain-containing protein [Acidiphilium sp.]|nr:filamentous hemagglutinin N-terminal domain-containing protein [Acidiphilium sp.]